MATGSPRTSASAMAENSTPTKRSASALVTGVPAATCETSSCLFICSPFPMNGNRLVVGDGAFLRLSVPCPWTPRNWSVEHWSVERCLVACVGGRFAVHVGACAYDLIRPLKLLRAAARPPGPCEWPPSGALSRWRRGRQVFPSADPHRCAEICPLVRSEKIDRTDTVVPKVAYKRTDPPCFSGACQIASNTSCIRKCRPISQQRLQPYGRVSARPPLSLLRRGLGHPLRIVSREGHIFGH